MVRRLLTAGVVAFGVGCIGAGAVFAQGNVIEDRKKAMKAMSAAAKPAVAMMKGEAKFDAAKVKASLASIAAEAEKSLKLYPKGSDKGETRALPAIWEKKDDFDAKLRKLAADAKAASGKITDVGSLKANFPMVLKNCGGCHKPYRAAKKS